MIATIRNAQSQPQPSRHDAETARGEPEKRKRGKARATARNAQASRHKPETAGNEPDRTTQASNSQRRAAKQV